MNAELTELVFILDRSGSMGGLESDTIGGFNGMIERQKKEREKVNVTTFLFDDEVERICEVDPVTGHVNQSYQLYIIYPANGYATSMDIINHAADTIQEELDERLAYFDEQGKPHFGT